LSRSDFAASTGGAALVAAPPELGVVALVLGALVLGALALGALRVAGAELAPFEVPGSVAAAP